MDKPSIAEFYADKNVFITGATGFVGKVLLEKLIRSCPDVGDVYLLIRPKKGLSVQARLDNLLDSKLFDKVRERQPSLNTKVIPVAGDILEPGLGLSESDVKKLVDNVNIVFHSAATVKFDEPLKLSVEMNVVGVARLLEISHQIKNLEALIHISTAYANCDQQTVVEMIYPPPISPEKLISAMEWMEDDVVDTLTVNLIGVRPNTYTFTKAVAESLLVERCNNLPCAIVRPSIVGSSWREPIEGWVDNFNGPTGLLAAIGKGILRVMMGDSAATADIIPVDMAANLVLAAAWHTAISDRSKGIQVFNCTTGQTNKITWGEIERGSKEFFTSIPLDSPVRVPDPTFTLSRVYYALNNWFDQLLPAWFMDMGLKLMGKKAILWRLQSRLWRNVQCLEYFTSNEWNFTSDNVTMLRREMNADDQEEFNFDVKRIHWRTYLQNYCVGVKRYALHESMQNLPEARIKLRKLQWRRFVKQCILVLTGSLVFVKVGSLRRLIIWFCSLFARLYVSVTQILGRKTPAIPL